MLLGDVQFLNVLHLWMTDKNPNDHNADFHKHYVVNVQETISTQTQSTKLAMCVDLGS